VTNLPVLLENLPLQLRLNMWFQQNACLSHTSRLVRATLNAMFSNKISKYGPINYPSWSPDLTVLDYYFWEKIKNFYHERLTTRDNIIRRISETFRSLRAEEILRAINCFQNRVNACIAKNGVHFEHLVAVRGKRIYVNRAYQTWEAKRLTWIKHSERERRGDLCESSTPIGWNFRHVHVVQLG